MLPPRLFLAVFLGGLSLSTTACTDRYGYSGVGLGVGAGPGYYGDPYHAGGGYYGWYDDYYYPGTGTYVYDRARRPYLWNDGQRRYWEQRRYGNRDVRANWRDFRRNRQALRQGHITRDQFRQDARREYRDLRRGNRAEGYRTSRPNRAFRRRARR